MIGLSATNGKDLYADKNPSGRNPHMHPNNPNPQTNAYMATEYDPPPIRDEARE